MSVFDEKFMEHISCIFFYEFGTQSIIFFIRFDNIIFAKTFYSSYSSQIYVCFIKGAITKLVAFDGQVAPFECF